MQMDFGVHLLPGLPEAPGNPEDSLFLAKSLYASGIRVAVDVAPFEESPVYLQRWNLLIRMAHSAFDRKRQRRLHGLQVLSGTAILLSEENICGLDLTPFCIKSALLPVLLPQAVLTPAEKALFPRLFHQGIQPIIMNTEQALLFATDEWRKELFRLPYVCFHFNQCAFLHSVYEPILVRAVTMRAKILLGSGTSYNGFSPLLRADDIADLHMRQLYRTMRTHFVTNLDAILPH